MLIRDGKIALNHRITKVILALVLFVARHLLSQKAALLPHVCQIFFNVQCKGHIKSVQVTMEAEEINVMFSSRWLLHQPIVKIMHKCVNWKFGSLLVCKGAALLTPLSWALGLLELPQWFEPSVRQKYTQHLNKLKKPAL